MSRPPSPPILPGRSLRSVAGVFLRAGGWAVLAATLATLAWAAPAGAPGSPALPPGFKQGDSCPVPGRLTAADGSLSGFVPAPRLYLEVDGKDAPAELYRVPGRAILVISPRLSSPLVLAAMTVASVPSAKLDRHPDGTVDVRRDAELKPLGPYQIDDTKNAVSFSIGGHSQVLRVLPPLDFLRAPGATSSQPPH
jgi:hypothetical protein